MILKNPLFSTTFAIAAAVLVFNACAARKTTAKSTDECAGVTPTYTSQVKVIIDDACGTKCHSAKYKAGGGIDLSNYATVKKESTNARFMGSLRHLAGFAAMPLKAPKFSDSVLKILNCWVKNGSPE